jgi:hypothetical protein
MRLCPESKKVTQVALLVSNLQVDIMAMWAILKR